MDNRPIGFMDSGVGGLSVVKAAHELLPNEEIIFIGDEARMPYGPRAITEVIEYSKQMAHFLIKKGVKAIVIACNTATNAAYEILKKELSIPVIGVILPGAESALSQSKGKRIGVIATEGTIKAKAYQLILNKLDDEAQIFSLACQDFVTIVEKNEALNQATEPVVEKQLEPLLEDKIDTLILGCTHFPLLTKAIQKAVGNNVKLVDPGIETVRQLAEILEKNGLKRKTQGNKNDQYFATGDIKKVELIAQQFLKSTLTVNLAKID